MSALAKLLVKQGYDVSGSDLNDTIVLKQLNILGIKTFVGHNASNINNQDLVVYTAAIPQDNVELVKAKQLNIKCFERAELLGEIAKLYDKVIAIAGMHGKTTTTAMLGKVFLQCGLEPTIHLGGDWDEINGNLFIGKNNFFITEACEYRDTFLHLYPQVSIITNIEKEHLDYFKNFANIKRSFNSFCLNTKLKVFILNRDKKHVISNKLTTFSKTKGDIIAKKIKDYEGRFSFDCYVFGELYGHISLKLQGEHNVLNALAVIGVAEYYKLPRPQVIKALSEFCGVKRRFEVMKIFKGGLVVRDYAHHPTEIKCAIKTAIDSYKVPVIAVFQPHTYSRTRSLMEKFKKCFAGIESLVLVKTYPARETYDRLGSCEALKEGLMENKNNFKIYGPFEKRQVKSCLKGLNLQGKVILFLGAGDIVEIIKGLK